MIIRHLQLSFDRHNTVKTEIRPYSRCCDDQDGPVQILTVSDLVRWLFCFILPLDRVCEPQFGNSILNRNSQTSSSYIFIDGLCMGIPDRCIVGYSYTQPLLRTKSLVFSQKICNGGEAVIYIICHICYYNVALKFHYFI